MLLRRLMAVLFLLTQVTVAVAVPAADVAADSGVISEHCADSSGREGGHALADHEPAHDMTDGECTDSCQLCAACAAGLAGHAHAIPVMHGDSFNRFRDRALPPGVVSPVLRPPSYS